MGGNLRGLRIAFLCLDEEFARTVPHTYALTLVIG
jgi:hypothetical protein